jgi:hypothetical protein
MAFNATTLNAYLKRVYDPKFIDNSMTGVTERLLKVIKKETDGSGDNYSWLVDADDDFNGSAVFSTAQTAETNSTNAQGGRFQSNWMPWYAVAQVSSEIIGQTRNNDGAWQKAVDRAMTKRMRGIAHANAIFMQGYGWGEVSQITSSSGATFVPKIRSDITKYVRGMQLVFSTSLNGAVLRSTTALTVQKVNYTQGSELVTLSGNLSGPGAADNDWAFLADARENSATPNRKVIVGMGAWFPNQLTDLSDATITTLLTVDRSANSRYYGTFIDATGGGSALGAVIDGAQEACTIGNAKKLEMFCSKAVFSGIAKDAQNAVRYTDSPVKAVGTNRLLVYADGEAEAHLQVSRTTNDNQIWGFDPGDITLKSIGGAPHIDMEDGLTMARQASSAGYEVRWFQQACLEFANPAAGLRIQLV